MTRQPMKHSLPFGTILKSYDCTPVSRGGIQKVSIWRFIPTLSGPSEPKIVPYGQDTTERG